MKKRIPIVLLITIIIVLQADVYYIWTYGDKSIETIMALAGLVVTEFAALVAVLALRNLYSAKMEEEEAQLFYQNIRSYVIPKSSTLSENGKNCQTKEKKQEEAADILELMLANMMEIKDYYVLSKAQARNSFSLAVVMCIMGFLLIGVSVAAAFLNAANLASTIIPAIGAAIVEIIAGTSLFVYRKSLDQLNHYYNSLHNNERFLSIVNIVSKVSSERQDDVYIEIIKSQINLISKEDLHNNKSNDEVTV